ncbi:MAG: class 1 fructose-bisphosphatase [Phenylobacterium sp.]|uniref:class 1 fructose-bisphosphatase n=1 Tax=Phenylobacterium sp. TaxID=1871053 RepID=UPI002721A391|nr:class 1 fructose-bisphosphatase [Phenylobacterium sp.]MDO9433622.1 class 1 fructose-bisphosphatase [Phenylobacterium sp.]
MTDLPTLETYLATHPGSPATAEALLHIGRACVEISRAVQLGAVGDHLGAAGATNVQDEEQKKLDVLADDILGQVLERCASVAGYASEEREHVELTGRSGGVLVLFDPLDGSSNIDVNVSIGTIFSILPAPDNGTPTTESFLRSGRHQLAAGYAVYGPQTVLVITVSAEVAAFTLDAEGVWRLTHERLRVPTETREFAINMSNQRHWAEPVRQYIAECLQGRDGSRGKDFNMRWVGSMVADVHRILMRGGVFLYPWDAREPSRPGKLRLLYEGAPMALLVERAGGAASDGQRPLLDVEPTSLHQRVGVVLGSAAEVSRLAA